jgi:ankyrin repeat protein
MSYTKLEQFYVQIFKKTDNLSKLETWCLNTYNTLMSACISKLCKDDLNYAINVYDVLKATHALLLGKGFHIVCLKFSDGNKIYIRKDELLQIPFFKGAFENMGKFDDVIIDFSLIDISDNYKYMNMIFNYMQNRNYPCDLTYSDTLQLAKLDSYLLGVSYGVEKLKDYIWILLVNDFDQAQEEGKLSEDYFNIICDICISLNINMNDIMKYLKLENITSYRDDILKSKLLKQLEIDDVKAYNNFMTYINDVKEVD